MEPMRRDSRTFYQKDEQWDGYRKGGVLITAVSGRWKPRLQPFWHPRFPQAGRLIMKACLKSSDRTDTANWSCLTRNYLFHN